MVGAAKPSEEVLVTVVSEAVLVDPAAVAVAVAVPAVVVESSVLASLGSRVPQRALMLLLHCRCPLALLVFSEIQSE